MTKRTVSMQVRELVNVNATHISLVKRGANRLPFRIIKTEKEGNSMKIDLNTLFLKKREANPTVVAIAIAKGASISEQNTADLKACGFEYVVDDTQESSTILKSENYNADDEVTGIKLANGMVALLSGVEKSLDRNMGSNFASNITVEMVMPSIRVASETLSEMLWDLSYQSMSKVETMDAVDSILSEYSDYVKGVLDAVPINLYKMEAVELPTEAAAEDTAPVADVVDPEAEPKPDAEVPAVVDPVADPVIDPATDPVVDPVVDPAVAVAEKSEDPMLAIQAQLDQIATTVAGVTALSASVTALDARLAKSEESTAALALSVTGIVVPTENEDSNNTSAVVKSDETKVFNDAFAFDGFETA